MDNTAAPHGSSPDQVHKELQAHRDRVAALADALNSIRAWRHTLPHTAAVHFAPLDAILDALALDESGLLQIEQPASLQEAVTAYRTVLTARRQALAATGLVWDRIEAAAIREIDRHMPRPTGGARVQVDVRPDPPHVAEAIRDIRRNGLPPRA
ncbi:hypothetical protein SUDANB1_05273 [Streptomyces sp. enrichment culture]